MQTICENIGITFNNGKIVIPDWVKHIKFDIGLGRYPVYSKNWLTTQPDTLIFGFEPNPIALGCIHENWIVSKEELGNKIFAIPVALSNESGELMFHVTDPWFESSSLLKPTSSLLTMIKSETKLIKVSVFKLSEFFELLALDSIDHIEYIKIDAQGVDLDIIKSGKDVVMNKVVWITLEADACYYENTSDTVMVIDEYMLSIGFIKTEHPNTVDPTYYNSKFESIKDTVYICQKN
jgi:FkbM family methyltransferase